MQNFKGFQNLDKLVWDSMTPRGYSQNTSSRTTINHIPLPLRKTDRLLKLICITVDMNHFVENHFVENSFLHILRPFPTLCDEQRRIKSQNTIKMWKKSFFCIFMVYPQKFEDCEFRHFSQVRQTNVIFWIY